jgi:hypothetical protein
VNRKAKSPTQPGRGIRKIIDLYYGLPDLLDKANKHAKILRPDVRGSGHDSDDMELLGMTEEEIERMLKEYVYFPFPSSS